LKTDGTLWGWGNNANSQVGLGNTVSPQTLPVQIGSANDWVAVRAARSFSLALKADGSLWAWGLNSRGQLGLGDTSQRVVPTRVGNANHWASLSAARESSAAVTVDGRIFCAGFNGQGQLGNGETHNLLSFTEVASGGFVEVAMGAHTLLARHQDGSLWTAGAATFASLSGGRDPSRFLPVLPGLASQFIPSPPPNARTWLPQASSGLPVRAVHLSGPGEVIDGRLSFTGVEGQSANFMIWQEGDDSVWDAVAPKLITLDGVQPLVRVFDGTEENGLELTSSDSTLNFGSDYAANPPWRLLTVSNAGGASLSIH
jgi:hypothetical protein